MLRIRPCAAGAIETIRLIHVAEGYRPLNGDALFYKMLTERLECSPAACGFIVATNDLPVGHLALPVSRTSDVLGSWRVWGRSSFAELRILVSSCRMFRPIFFASVVAPALGPVDSHRSHKAIAETVMKARKFRAVFS